MFVVATAANAKVLLRSDWKAKRRERWVIAVEG